MLHKTRNLVEDWREGDARKLAALEMEADVGWPGGGGWQTTAEEQERNIKESNLLGAIVTENEERIISLCTIRATPGQKAQAFIPHLNCHPDFHGKKHGKSALWGAMERAYEAGYQRVDLYTWPGNLQAVPLYKKMGFMWRPDSSVHMENFTPAARRHPLAASFFDQHDWYETQVRELEPEEDVMMRGRVKVYEYLWRAPDGDLLRLVFDRQSWGIIEIENNDLTVSCSLPDEKLVAGISHAVRWRIVNKKPHPAHVFLATSGDPGVRVEKREALDVADTAEIEDTFVIDPNIEEKTREPKAAVLRTDLVIDGVGIELAAGIDVRQAVDVSIDAPRSILTPGKPHEARLTLRSNLDEACAAELRVMPAGGVDVDANEQQMMLDPKGGAELTVPLEAPGAGPVSIDVRTSAAAAGKEIPVKTKRLDLLAVEPGGASGAVGTESALLCGGGLTVSADLRNGELYIFHTLRALRSRRLKLQAPRLGPPFAGGDLFQEKAEARVERDGFGLVLRLRTPSVTRPGVWLERSVQVGKGPLVRVLDTVINGTSLPLDLSVTQSWWIQMGRTAALVVPGKQGVSRQAFGSGGRDLDDLRLSEEASAWLEGWFCVERDDGCAAGVLWGRADRVSPGPWGSLRTRAVRVKPGASTSLDPVYAFVGDGNWQTVRAWWRTLCDSVPEVETSQAPARRPIECRIEPRPPVVAGAPVEAKLRLDHVGRYKLDGELILEDSDGLCPDIGAVKVTGLCESRPVVRKVVFRRVARVRPGARDIRARFETEEAVYRFTQKALVLPADAREVTVSRREKGGVLAIDNGILSAKVAPAFMGSVISLSRDGMEYLNCPYPNAEPRAWMNPWYGGLSPEYDRLEDTLYKERFRYRVIERKGRQGLVWRGVRVHCRIAQEHARGQSIAWEYLLAPGADVLAIRVTCRDELGISADGDLGFGVWPAFAASPGTARFYNATEESVSTFAAPHWTSGGNWHWGGIVGKDGQALFLSATGEGARAAGFALGEVGCFLLGNLDRWMKPRERIEALYFLLPASSIEEGKAGAVWSEFDTLP